MTELTLKVLPRPLETAHRMLRGLDDRQAIRAMSIAMGSQADLAAAAHLPADIRGGKSVTMLRMQGFGPSVAARCAMLDALLADFGGVEVPLPDEAAMLWDCLRTLAPLGHGQAIWRISVPPSRAPDVVEPLRAFGARWMFDWAGGLIWIASDADPAVIRNAATGAGGHAALIRSDEALRRRTPAFHPAGPGLAGLETRVRRAFDPAGVFETGRF